MADPRAFISFDYDNNLTEKNLFIGQMQNSRTPFNAEDWSSKETLPQATWERQLNEKIGRCHLMIVLVGRSTASATGVRKEITFAKTKAVPYFGVYVDGAGSTSLLPTGLDRNRTISWDWNSIASTVSQMMTEGKNRKRR